jgi:anti-sigma B factor antagonist
MNIADLDTQLVDGILFAHLRGEIDMSNAAELGSAVAARISNDALGLVLDLTEVEYLDSAGLHTIFELRARLRDRGQQLRLVVPAGATIAQALEIMDVPRTIGVAESAAAARQSIEAAVPQGRSDAASNPGHGAS